MKQTSKWLVLMGALLIVAAILVACGGQQAEPTTAPATESPVIPATEPPVPELVGDPIRGGLLYDNWMKVLGVDTPKGDQPLWATQSSNTRNGKDTWRCKECHGWDYKGVDGAYGGGSHKTGFAGLWQVAGTDANEILTALKTGDHDFSVYMDDQALTDIALFLSGDMLDSAAFIADKKAVGGNPSNGENIFADNCAECHGPQGTAINFSDENSPEYFGTIAIDNPWEFVHKARFGQPGEEDMPALIGFGLSNQDYIDLLAYAQTLPTVSPAVAEGGKLFDNWIKQSGSDPMTEDHPLWGTQTTNTRTGNDTWRCKECHGWDYLGVDGRYSSGSHTTGFPGIFASKGKTSEELLTALKGENHDFSTFLQDEQLSALVAFVQQLQDLSPYINEDKSVNGDTEHGKSLYDATCAECHGEDGKEMDFDDGEGVEFIGTLAVDNPWELFNKVAHGQPGVSKMPAGVNLGWSWQNIVDVLAYLQTLPVE